jgi:hypothetical protein
MSTRKVKVKIIESILDGDVGQDGIALGEFLRMGPLGGVQPTFVGGSAKRSDFLDAILTSTERYLHISAHGGQDAIYIHGERETPVTTEHVSDYIASLSIRGMPLRGCFVTLSACGHIGGGFAKDFGEVTGATAVLAPLTTVQFAENFAFFSLFYFALGNHPKAAAKADNGDRLAQYLDTFQRAKVAYLMLGGSGAFRLDYWIQGEHHRLM